MSLWRTFFDAQKLAITGDLGGSPVCDMRNVIAIAEAHGEVADATFLRRFGVMFEAIRLNAAKKK
jgi:hypothetical protein